MSRRIDWVGFITFSAALFMLVYALVQGNAKGWSSHLIRGLLLGSAVLLVVFLLAEWLQRDPMLDLRLFKRPAMVGVSVASFSLAASIFAMFLYLSLYLQEVLGYGPFAAGLRFLPVTMLAFVVAPVAGKLSVQVQSRYLLALGLFLVALGCELMTRVHADSGWTVLLPGFVAAGIGVGVVNPVLAGATVAVVPPERSGMATGSSTTFRQVGFATGIAGLGAVFLNQIRPNTVRALIAMPGGSTVLAHTANGMNAAITGGGIRPAAAAIHQAGARAALLSAYRTGFTSTFDHLMAIATAVALVGAVGSLVLVRQRDFVPSVAAGDGSTPSSDAATSPAAPATAQLPSRPRPRHAHSKRRRRDRPSRAEVSPRGR